jgi:hypothetical protein
MADHGATDQLVVKYPEYYDEIRTHVGEIFPNPNG